MKKQQPWVNMLVSYIELVIWPLRTTIWHTVRFGMQKQADMLEEMQRNVRDTSLVVKNLFNQYDLHARGCVSGEQFLRVVSCQGLLSADKVPWWGMFTS